MKIACTPREDRMKTVLLVDDHQMFRECLALWLRQAHPAWRILQAGSVASATRLLGEQPLVDLVVLDLDLPDSDPATVVPWVRAAAGDAPILVLSGADDERLLGQARAQGAARCLCKSGGTGELGRVIRAMLPDAQGGMAESSARLSTATADATVPDMSERQLDVLRLLAEGKPNKMISRELQLSEATVKTHLHALFMKLQVNSRTQAVVAASRLGLLGSSALAAVAGSVGPGRAL